MKLSPILFAALAASSPAAPDAPLSRADFNRWAVRLNLPVYWIADGNGNGHVDADEVAALLFYPSEGNWVRDGKLTPEYEVASRAITAAAQAPRASGPDGRRQQLVGEDLDAGVATLVHSDLAALSSHDKAFVDRMMTVAKLIDALHGKMRGAAALEARLPADPASRSLFRRNGGPGCVAPSTRKEPACSAIPGSPQPIFDLYPAELQADEAFCAALEKHPDAGLEDHFSVVRRAGADYRSVPYTEAYPAEMGAIGEQLLAAAELAAQNPSEAALAGYLRAAAASFETKDWSPADELWASMGPSNSKWYVRVAPDETYWEPCARKAGFQLSFARINQASREWQRKLSAVRQDMEQQIAQRAGAPYAARQVAFQLPDFIDIVINAGEARRPLSATVGQSLPNWGPVVDAGRGRTVVMTNLYQDADSRAARRAQAESVLDASSMRAYAGRPEPSLLASILHEATHNLGPSHDYTVGAKTAEIAFGGPLAAVMEELKAQTGALFLLELLRARRLISDQLAVQSQVDSIVWALGQISQGMYSGSEPKTYGQVAAIQIGYLIQQGALTWSAERKAANGTDAGALVVHYDRLVPAADSLMRLVAGIKARGDRAAARELVVRYVDGTAIVPHAAIAERFLRVPQPSFVYAVSM